MSIEITNSNPFRVVDWRWGRATEIREGHGLPSTKRRDGLEGHAWIKKAIVFQRQLQRAGTEREKIVLSERHPGMFWAHQLWDNASPQKHAIEAYILSRLDNRRIAFQIGVPESVVEAYEAVFFNVRDKMMHSSYILNCVMGPAIHRGLSERHYDLLWKLYGYFLGPHVVKALESKFASPMWCGTPESVNAAIMDDAVSTLKLKAAVAVKTVEVNQYNQLALMDQFTKFVEVERNSDDAGKSQAQILDHIDTMMECLPFNVGGRDPRGTAILNPTIQSYEQSAIELTYEEIMRLSVGKPIVNGEVIKTMAFPVTDNTQVLEGPNA